MAITIGSGITIGAGIAVTSNQLGSYVFNGTSGWMNVSGSLSDWNLGSTYTIEWWQNSPSSLPSSLYTVASQGDSSSAIDVFWESGALWLRNGSSGATGEPTPNVWNQIAVVSTVGALAVYYNGTAVASSGGGSSLSDVASTVAVGRRGPNNTRGTSQSIRRQQRLSSHNHTQQHDLECRISWLMIPEFR